MDDDFNTAKGVGILFNLVKEGNRILDEGGDSRQGDGFLATLTADLVRMGGILGILQHSWQVFFEQRGQRRLEKVAISPDAIDALVAERTDARKKKDWKRADEIREQLEKDGIVLEDKADGTHWKVAT
jgi:cysteinyl-tRNA synthetase